MEWFKCEKCSQQLDKPELFYHFLICPAKKGNYNYHLEVQETVAAADNNGSSNQPQWFCSLCNVEVESQHDLFRHDDWQKPWKKVPKQQPSEEAGVQVMERQKVKKAKLEPVASGAKSEKISHEAEKEVERDEEDARKESGKEKVNWKKLIVSVLKDEYKLREDGNGHKVPDGALKMRTLQKLVLKRLEELGVAVDVSNFSTIIEHKVNSSIKCTIDGKYVRLAASLNTVTNQLQKC